MDTVPRSYWIIVPVLIFIASWLAATESSIAACNQVKIRLAKDRGDSRAANALYVLENFDRAITTILICTNVVHIAAASLVTIAVTRAFGAAYVTLSTLVMTALVFFFGEMLPKSIAKKYADRFTLSHAGTLKFLMLVLRPFSSFLALIGKAAGRLSKEEQELTVTEDELMDIIEDLTEEGTLEESEGELIQSAMEFGETKVLDIMTPISKVCAIEESTGPSEIVEILVNQSHSRLPVYKGDLNHITGILQIRSYIRAYIANKEAVDTASLLTEPLFIDGRLKIDELLDIMAEKRFSLAIVRDKAGNSIGVVSVEDVLEELVGEIYDEEDEGGAK